ncbi:MAG: GGDEF domain-containing protein [Bacillota bacterium]
MKTSKQKKLNIWHVLFAISLISLLFLACFKTIKQDVADAEKTGLLQLDTITSYIQRVAKLELEDSYTEELLVQLEIFISEIMNARGESVYFSHENEEVFVLLQEFKEEYYTFVEAIYDFRGNGVRDHLFNASEYNYSTATVIITEITSYVEDSQSLVGKINTFLTWNVFISVFLLGIILLNIMRELKQNKALSEKMYIDISTGLYNRSKCQEILKLPIDEGNPKERAIIIFDLNDLKKTNDNLGHRAGDDLIACFALKIKEATRIFPEEIFVGRYGGDEFMAYFDSVEKQEVELYLDEVQYLIDEFNRSGEKPFRLSCAAGYCITTKDTKNLTMREIFDQADVNMYANKIEMKKNKKEELLRQGITEDFVDDRLA